MSDFLFGFAHVVFGWKHRPAIGYMVNSKDPCWFCGVIERRWSR